MSDTASPIIFVDSLGSASFLRPKPLMTANLGVNISKVDGYEFSGFISIYAARFLSELIFTILGSAYQQKQIANESKLCRWGTVCPHNYPMECGLRSNSSRGMGHNMPPKSARTGKGERQCVS